MSDNISELTGNVDKKIIYDNKNESSGNLDQKSMRDMFQEFELFFSKKEYKGFLSLLIKLQIYITKLFDKLKILKEGHLFSRLAASSTLFFIPSYVSGYWLQETYNNYEIMTHSLRLTLVWGLISPFLLLYAAAILNKLFQEHENKFKDKAEWDNIYLSTLKHFFSSKNSYIGLAWSTIIALIVLRYFADYPTLVIFWASISSFCLSLISFSGFHGISTIANMMNNIFSIENRVLKFDVNDPDNSGGFLSFNNFIVSATLLFSSGTLIIPIGFDICRKCNNNNVYTLTVLLVLIYILMIGYCFFMPLFKIKKFVANEKERLIRDSLNKLNKMIHDFEDNDKKDLYTCLKSSANILVQSKVTHPRLEMIKTNPWDFKSLSEFSFSVLVPTIVTIIQLKEKL